MPQKMDGGLRVAVASAEMIRTVERFGEWAHGGKPLTAAREWEGYGFSHSEAAQWLEAGCFEPSAAHHLEDRGVAPSDAARRLAEFENVAGPIGEQVTRLLGYGHGPHAVGYLVANGNLSANDAQALIDGKDQ